MTRLIRAEVQKLMTVWSTYVLIAITAGASGLLGLAVALAPHQRATAGAVLPAKGTVGWFDDIFSVMTIAQSLALVLGIIIVTGEFRHKTVTPTYLAEPRRERVVAAKLVVAAAAGVVVAVASGLAALLLGVLLVAAGYGNSVRMITEFSHVLPGVLAGAILFAAYGAGLGALLKNQVVALVVGLGITAVVEPIIVAVWPTVGRWLPSQAARSLQSIASTSDRGAFGGSLAHLIPSWQGALILLGYGILLAVAGSVTSVRADVS